MDFTTKERVLVPGGLIDELKFESQKNEEELQEIVYKIYELTRRTHPDREGDLPALLRNYRGREEKLLSKLISKPDLLLKLKKSYEPRRNHVPLSSNVIKEATSRLDNTIKQEEENLKNGVVNDDNQEGKDLFASFRDSLMFESESSPMEQVDGEKKKKEGLSNLVMNVFNSNDGNDENEKAEGDDDNGSNNTNNFTQKIIPTRPRGLSVEQVAAGEVEEQINQNKSSRGGGGGLFNSFVGMLDHETGFNDLTDEQKKERLNLREISSYIYDPNLDISSDVHQNWIKVKDRVECFRELNTLKERAKWLETLNLDDAILILVELKLRGDYHDVLGAVQGKGALGAIKQKAKTASDNKPIPYGQKVINNNGQLKFKIFQLLPPETYQLITCTSETQLAKILSGLNLIRAGILLLEMRRRGNSGPVLDCLTAGGLGAILSNLPPPERSALLVTMSVLKCNEVIKSLTLDDQVLALCEMSDNEIQTSLSLSFNQEEQEDISNAIKIYKEKELKKELKLNKKKKNGSQFEQFNMFSSSSNDNNEGKKKNGDDDDDDKEEEGDVLGAFKSPTHLISSISAKGKRRTSTLEDMSQFADNANKRALMKKHEHDKEKAKEARENATRAREASAAATQALQTASEKTPSKASAKTHHTYLANLLAEANAADEEAKKAEELANKLEEELKQANSDDEGSDEDGDGNDDDHIGKELLNSATSLFGGVSLFTANASSDLANQANEATQVINSHARDGFNVVGDATGGVVDNVGSAVGNVANTVGGEVGSVANNLSQVSSQVGSGLDDAVALPSWARTDGGNEDDEEGSNDGNESNEGSKEDSDDDGNGPGNKDVSDVVSEATTDLDGISERGAGDGDILDSMVWSYLMSGLPQEEQAKYEAMNDDQRRNAMGLAASRATQHRNANGGNGGGVGGVDFSNMTSGEAAVAAKRLREAAEKAKRIKELEKDQPWNQFNSLFSTSPTIFDPSLPLPPPDHLHPNDTTNPFSPSTFAGIPFDSLSSWLPVTNDDENENGGQSKKENGSKSVGFSDAMLSNVRSSFTNQQTIEATQQSLILGSDSQLKTTLKQHEDACVRAILTKRNMNNAIRENDETYLEEETPPPPLVEVKNLIGYTDVDVKAQQLFSSQDAKILSSKWGISVSEIKILAKQLALCTGDNGIIDPRMVPFLMNRLGYFNTLDMGLIPPQAKAQEIGNNSSSNQSQSLDKDGMKQLTWRLPANQASLKVLTPVDFADIFGKSALALAESDKPSPPTAGDPSFRISFNTTGTDHLHHNALNNGSSSAMAANKNKYALQKDKVLYKDCLAGLSGTSDLRFSKYLYVFQEMCQGSMECTSILQGYSGTRLNLMETRLLGRGLRRVGCGKPSALQAKMISKIVGIRLLMPEVISQQLGWTKSKSNNGDDNGDDKMDDGYNQNPSHVGYFEFLACISVMIRYEDTLVDTSSLINGDDDDEGIILDEKQRNYNMKNLQGRDQINTVLMKTISKSQSLASNIAKRLEIENEYTKKYDDVDHGFSGGQLFLLNNLFNQFSEDFSIHRKTVKVINQGLRAFLRSIGILALSSQIKAIRATYGDLGLNLHIDQFFLLCSNLHHWFPIATPKRILIIAGKISVNYGLGLSSITKQHHNHHSMKEMEDRRISHHDDNVSLSVVSELKHKSASRSTLTARASYLNKLKNEENSIDKKNGNNMTIANNKNDEKMKSNDNSFIVGDIYKLEHAFSVYDYSRNGVINQLALRALLRRLHVNWSAKQFVRVTSGALGATLHDYDVDDFVTLLASTSAVMVHTKLEKKEGQPGRRVANHHAKILYSHFSVIWNLPSPQILLIQRIFLEEELKTNLYGGGDDNNGENDHYYDHQNNSLGSKIPDGYSERTTVPRSSIRGILNKLGINYARVEASGLSETFDVNGHNAASSGNGQSVDFDELLGIVAHVVHLYGYMGDGHVDDPLSNLKDDDVIEARRSYFSLAIDPSSGKAPAKHCLVALRQLKLVKTDMALDKCLRLSGTMPQYRSGWLSWPSFIRLLAQLNYQKLKDEKLLKNKKSEFAYPNLKPSRSKNAETSDINKLRNELSGFINQHNDFENYMERLNHTYKILQNESSEIVPARPPEPEEAPISKKDQRSLTSAMSFTSKGSFNGGTRGMSGVGMSFLGRSNSFGFRKKSKGTNSFNASEASWNDQDDDKDPFSFDKKSNNVDLDFKQAKGGMSGDSRDVSTDSLRSMGTNDEFNWDDA